MVWLQSYTSDPIHVHRSRLRWILPHETEFFWFDTSGGSLPALNQCFLVGQTCPQGHQVESRVDEGCRSIESVAAGSSRLGKGS